MPTNIFIWTPVIGEKLSCKVYKNKHDPNAIGVYCGKTLVGWHYDNMVLKRARSLPTEGDAFKRLATNLRIVETKEEFYNVLQSIENFIEENAEERSTLYN